MGRAPKLDGESLLRAVATAPDPVVTAPELASDLEYTTDGVRNRLDALVADGLLNSRDVGARATIYWITPAGREAMQ